MIGLACRMAVQFLIAAACLASAVVAPAVDEDHGVFDALNFDDECLAANENDCASNALQLRSHKIAAAPAQPLQRFEMAAPEWPKEPPVVERAADHVGVPPQLFALQAHGMVLLPYGLSCVAFFALILLVWIIFNAVARYSHYARFLACQQKVKRVREAFLKQSNDLPLCPYCVEFIKIRPAPFKVVFICGHSFHLDCANKSFTDCPEKAGSCPICEKSGVDTDTDTDTDKDDNALDGSGALSNEGVRSFILGSLQRMFPEFISEACRQRWATCHIEVWLSELVYPELTSKLRFRCSPCHCKLRRER